ncbi:unnamed protein product, partial [Ectocarpus sp. 4 AP-2014]
RRGGRRGKGQCGITRYHNWPTLSSRQADYLKPAS